MKITFISLIFFFSTSFLVAQNNDFKWSDKEKLEKIKNLQDSTKWDKKLFLEDLNEKRPKISNENMNFGIYPVNSYKQGLESGINSERNYFGKKLFWNYFTSEKNIVNKDFLKGKNNEVFFAIIILTDLLNFSEENYNMSSHVISRNYPDKVGSGILKTKNNSIEYIAFLTGDRKQFALVNLRLFDLDQGRLILIAPQKDGSLRSMQIQMPILENTEINEYIRNQIKHINIKNFLLNKGNI